MLGLFRRTVAAPAPSDVAVRTKHGTFTRAQQQMAIETARWHAFQSLRQDEAGDVEEARLHLVDAGEFLAQIGGPLRPESAEAIYQWCAAREAGEV